MKRCSTVRSWIALDGAGALPQRFEAELRTHVSACAACAAQLRAARRLSADLTRLRGDAPIAPDVAARVLARIAVAPRVRREEVVRRELAWIAAGIGAVVLAGMATAIAQAPLLLDLLERSGAAATRLRTVFLALASPTRRLFDATGTAVLGVCGALSRAATDALGGAPSISVLAWIALLVVVSTTALVVRRDLRRPKHDKES
jgi:hypothetical protein